MDVLLFYNEIVRRYLNELEKKNSRRYRDT